MGEDGLAEYRRQILQWRQERENGLRSPEGWLALAGLFNLSEGEYTVGSDADNDIVLPSEAPARLGALRYQMEKAVFTTNPGETVIVDGMPVEQVIMVDNRAGRQPTVVKIGNVSFNLHKFGAEVALRVRDRMNPAIQGFAGLAWYEIKPEYKVQGQLLRQVTPNEIMVTTSVKTAAPYPSAGAIHFELLGQPLTLLGSVTSKADELFIIFRDSTAGHTTYGAGRYLYAPVDAEGAVTLDFNKAYSPPCAFTPYATCSLPPRENVLQVAIEAGEIYPETHEET